ncbi:cell division cycle 48C [Perilla frutescens var. hirtella]|nr:cell division cycle 48C [Perilla frutescens var. hirtella]
MGRKRGGPVGIRAWQEQVMRGHIESVAAGKTNLTAEQLVDLLRSAFPQSYYRRNRRLLLERVAKITPLSCMRNDAIDEPTPQQVEVLSSSVSTSSSEKDDSTDSEQNESDKLGDGRREMNDNGDGGRNRVMFRDLGGISGVIEELEREMIVPLHQLKLLRHLGVEPTARVLLHGPLGCGKTSLARAVANEAGLPFYEVSAAELVSGVSGASEENIRKLFSKANKRAPSIVFIDEIDLIASNIVKQLMDCMGESYRLIKPVNDDAGSKSSNSKPGYVLVIGAASRPDAVDPALRRLFDREIALGVPDENARLEILSVLTCNFKVEVGFDLAKIARCTTGFVGGDLAALAKKAGVLAVNRIMDKRRVKLSKEQKDKAQCDDYRRHPFSDEEMKNLSISMADFVEATKMVQPSSKREGFSTIPTAKWDDVGGLRLLREEFVRHIVRRIKFPEVYKQLGMNFSTTFFLYGPSGCGKTLIVKALANEAGANFIHIKGSELLNRYVDQRELEVRTIFSHARMCSPCILFFDEVDALTTPCGNERGGIVGDVLKQLLIELDDAEQRSGVYVIGATNRPEVMSPAMFKPGRFDKLLHVPLPSPEERGMILKALARDKPIDAKVDLMTLGKDDACENFSGADLTALMKEAATAAIDRLTLFDRGWSVPMTIKDADFKTALGKISPSVSLKQVQNCELFSMCY